LYTWRKEWINRFESLWSVFEKFKYANSISEKEVYEIFSIRDQHGSIRKYQSKENKTYLSMEGVDGNALLKILGVDIKQRNLNDIEAITYVIANHSNININDFYSNKLRFCPECIKNGYHSIFHQALLFDECFMHEGTKLISKCPNCLSHLEYEFNSKNNKLGFQCQYCSSFYLESSNIIDIFERWDMNEIELKNRFKKWVDLNRKYQKQNLSNTLFCFKPENIEDYYDYYHKFIHSDMLYNIFSLVEKKQRDHQYRSIKSINRIRNSKDNYVVKDFEIDIYKTYKAIFKSIARRIRKGIKQIDNKIKILQMSKMTFYYSDNKLEKYLGRTPFIPNIDLPTYAYLMWRMDIEGLSEYTKVHKRNKYGRFTYNAEEFYINIQSTEIYNYIIYELIRRLPDEKHTINYKCIIEHIIANLLLFHYKNWLDVAENIKSSEITMKEKIPYVLPFFLVNKSVEYPNETKIYTINLRNK